jgi:hypothetical protein
MISKLVYAYMNLIGICIVRNVPRETIPEFDHASIYLQLRCDKRDGRVVYARIGSPRQWMVNACAESLQRDQ